MQPDWTTVAFNVQMILIEIVGMLDSSGSFFLTFLTFALMVLHFSHLQTVSHAPVSSMFQVNYIVCFCSLWSLLECEVFILLITYSGRSWTHGTHVVFRLLDLVCVFLVQNQACSNIKIAWHATGTIWRPFVYNATSQFSQKGTCDNTFLDGLLVLCLKINFRLVIITVSPWRPYN